MSPLERARRDRIPGEVSSGCGARGGSRGAARGQGTLELALVVPLVLLLAVLAIGAGRITMGKMSVNAVAREMARAGAQTGKQSAASAGYIRGRQVADGYGLTNGSLALAMDTAGHAAGGAVWSTASYVIRFDDLPLLGWASVTVSSRGHERVDRYR